MFTFNKSIFCGAIFLSFLNSNGMESNVFSINREEYPIYCSFTERFNNDEPSMLVSQEFLYKNKKTIAYIDEKLVELSELTNYKVSKDNFIRIDLFTSGSIVNGSNNSNSIDMTNMFLSCKNLSSINFLNFEGTITCMKSMFAQCSSLMKIDGISKFDTNNVTNMSYIFYECESLKSLPDISNWNVSNVQNMGSMFSLCCLLNNLPDISNWNVSNVTNMSSMFMDCHFFVTLPDISNWNVNNVENMSYMFRDCYLLISLPDIRNWDVSNVKNMSYMFYGCSSLISLPDIDNWNVSNVTNMGSMFYDCSSLVIFPDISNWNVNNVTDMSHMFSECNSLINSPTINTNGKAKYMYKIFSGCTSLSILSENINLNDGEDYNSISMFDDCVNLKKLTISALQNN